MSSQSCSETLTSFQPGAEHPAILLDYVHVISLLRVTGWLGPEGVLDSCGSQRGQRPAGCFPSSCQVGTTSFGWQRDTAACEVACEWQGLPVEGKTKCKSSPVTSQTRWTRFCYGKRAVRAETSVVWAPAALPDVALFQFATGIRTVLFLTRKESGHCRISSKEKNVRGVCITYCRFRNKYQWNKYQYARWWCLKVCEPFKIF